MRLNHHLAVAFGIENFSWLIRIILRNCDQVRGMMLHLEVYYWQLTGVGLRRLFVCGVVFLLGNVSDTLHEDLSLLFVVMHLDDIEATLLILKSLQDASVLLSDLLFLFAHFNTDLEFIGNVILGLRRLDWHLDRHLDWFADCVSELGRTMAAVAVPTFANHPSIYAQLRGFLISEVHLIKFLEQ